MASVAAHLSFHMSFCCLAMRSSLMVELSATPYAKAYLVLHICGRFCYASCCIMALSQKLTQRLHEYIEMMPNTLYAHADCKGSGEVYPFCHWQTSTADCNKLSLEQQKVFISWASVCKSWTNAEVCGMRSRAEHAGSGNCYQNSVVAAIVICWWSSVECSFKLKLKLSLSHASAPAVSFFVWWYRAEDVAPDPKCSNVMLIKASAMDSP